MGWFILGFTTVSHEPFWSTQASQEAAECPTFSTAEARFFRRPTSCKVDGALQTSPLPSIEMILRTFQKWKSSNYDSPLDFPWFWSNSWFSARCSSNSWMQLMNFWLFPTISLSLSTISVGVSTILQHFSSPRRQKPCSGMMRIKAVALPFCFFLFGASTVISHWIWGQL